MQPSALDLGGLKPKWPFCLEFRPCFEGGWPSTIEVTGAVGTHSFLCKWMYISGFRSPKTAFLALANQEPVSRVIQLKFTRLIWITCFSLFCCLKIQSTKMAVIEIGETSKGISYYVRSKQSLSCHGFPWHTWKLNMEASDRVFGALLSLSLEVKFMWCSGFDVKNLLCTISGLHVRTELLKQIRGWWFPRTGILESTNHLLLLGKIKFVHRQGWTRKRFLGLHTCSDTTQQDTLGEATQQISHLRWSCRLYPTSWNKNI